MQGMGNKEQWVFYIELEGVSEEEVKCARV